MNTEMLFVFGLIAIVSVAMASNRVRFDIIALLVVVALGLSGILSVQQAVAGFGNTVVILVAGLLVVGEMLDRTGIARKVGDIIARKGGKNEGRLLVVIMLAASILGSVMSSTAIVAIFIPIVVRIANETGISKSKLLLPMSYAALISGMLSLIATPTNLVVHGELQQAGFDGFSFFSFTPLGLVIMVTAVVYFMVFARKLLPTAKSASTRMATKRSTVEMFRAYNLEDKALSYKLTTGSDLIGKPIRDTHLPSTLGVRIFSIIRARKRNEMTILFGDDAIELKQGDILTVIGKPEAHQSITDMTGIDSVEISDADRQKMSWEIGTSSVLIHPDSKLIGKTLEEVEFQSKFGAQVVGIRRSNEPLSDFSQVKLEASDSLLLAANWEDIRQLAKRNHDFIVLEEPSDIDEIVPAYRKAPIALGILGMLVAASVLELAPLTIIVICTALAAIFTRCMSMDDAYRSIHWSSIILIAGLLPLADALDKTGGTDFIVEQLMNALGTAPHGVMFTALFFLTAVIGMFLSNTATAVLLAPIAIAAAEIQDISPYPYAIAVMIAASAAYSTPVSTPVVTLVMEPGEYSFGDYVKVGVPLLILTWLVTLLVTPFMFPY